MKLYGFFILLLYGCSHNDHIKWDTVVHDPGANAKTVLPEKMELPFEHLHARRFYLYADSILILLNNRTEDRHFVELYHLNSGEQIGAYFLLGNGPGEMLSADDRLNRNVLTITDFVKKQIAFINMDSLLQDKSHKIPVKPYTNSAQDIVPYGNDSIAYINPHCFTDDVLRIPNNKAARIVAADYGTSVALPKGFYHTFNVSAGLLVVNKERDRMVYASGSQSFFEIYDWSLHPVKRVALSSPLKVQYVVRSDEENHVPRVVFLNRVPYAFTKYCCSNSHLYLLYIGDFLGQGRKTSDFSAWVLKYDWDGNLLGSYYSERYLSSISLSSDETTMFATAYDDDELPVLVKFPLQ